MADTTNGTNKIPSGTAEGLMEFFDFLTVKGYATPAAVTPLKSASRQILATVEGEDFGATKVTAIDADEYVDRFENMVVGQYKQESLQQYRNRFKRGLGLYVAYLNDKQIPSFGSGRKRGVQRPPSKPAVPRSTSGAPSPDPIAMPPSTADRLIDYPVPLRSGQIAILRLPVKLEKSDPE